MKKLCTVLSILSAFFSAVATAVTNIPTAPPIEASSYILVDVDSGQILAAQNQYARVEPASTTKLMTAYLVFQALRENRLKLDQRISVSTNAWKKPGSSMFIDPRMHVPVDDLIKGMLVQSGNDATNLLAESIGGTVEGFVPMMNAQASLLGMNNTSFKNPEGLPTPGHLTTAYDLSILGISILRDFPEYAHYFSIKNYYYPGTPASNGTNRNRLLFRDPSVEGLKTGHTDSAGYCLVAAASRPIDHYGNRRLVAVVLGAASDSKRADETARLLNWGFRAYTPVKLNIANSSHEILKVWKGRKDDIKLGITSASIAVPAGSLADIETKLQISEPLIAPIVKGQQVGNMTVTLHGLPLRHVPIIALEEIEEANFFFRWWDGIILFLSKLF